MAASYANAQDDVIPDIFHLNMIGNNSESVMKVLLASSGQEVGW